MRRFAFAVLSVVVASAQGQIVLKPSGDDAIKLSPKMVDVRAEIRAGVADTVWTYTFANANRFRGQADFLIVIPKGGVVHGFAYWYQGEKVVARVTEKERAKRIYQAIVRRQRDPALIEMVGKNTFRVRVFPIDGDADLKVELKMAQVLATQLPSSSQGSESSPQRHREHRGITAGGATYSIPLRSLGKLESATVEVTGERKLQGSWGPVGSSLKYSIANSNAADLKVTEAWAPQALHASLRAARSGGPGGFFALALTPSRALAHRRWRLEGDVADVIELPGAGCSVMLVGRYRKPGPVRAWLQGDGYKASAELLMPEKVEANGPATKLWAWSKIGRSKDRKEIVALSMRHTVPSKYTSWIAIPTEERKRMAREIAQAELANEIAQVMPTLRKVGINSARGKAIVARINQKAKAFGVSPEEIWDEKLSEEADRLGERWEQAVKRGGDESPEARRILREIQAYTALGVETWRVTQHYVSIARGLARQVLYDRLAGRQDAESRKRAATMRRSARMAGMQDERDLLREVANPELWKRARKVVEAEREGRQDTEAKAQLTRMAAAAGTGLESLLREHRAYYAEEQYGNYIREFAVEVDRPEPNEGRLIELSNSFRREKAVIKANGRETYDEGAMFSGWARRFAQLVVEGKADPKDQEAIQERINRLAKATGLSSEAHWKNAWSDAYYQAYWKARSERDQARRNRRALADAEESLRRVEPYVDKETKQNTELSSSGRNLRQEYLEARRRGESGEELLRQLYDEDVAGRNIVQWWTSRSAESRKQWAKDRMERLRALTELDRLDEQKADAQVLARKRELEKKAEELRARMGDPIVSVEAPGAKVVVAKMPDGSWLPMHRVAGTERWEGRFDVPVGIADGRYSIIVYVDGERKAAVPINLDTAAPSVEVRWQGGRAEVLTDDDVKRVAGFTPSGERVELVAEAPGLFAARVPEGTRFVATDGAHNRSGSPSPLPLGEKRGPNWTNPGVVSALAFIGDRLWVGTANDGGGFDGEPRDAERPWIKAAAAYG
ncbi:hypothetical protein EON82_12050, partial [bacterium]